MAKYLAEIVGLLLVFAFIVWKVRPPLGRAMTAQAESIRTSITSAEQTRDRALGDLEVARAELARAREDAEAIGTQAAQTAGQLRAEGERRAAEEYDRIVRNANAEIAFERQRALAGATARIGAVVIAATESVVVAELSPERQRSLIGQAIDAAEAMA